MGDSLKSLGLRVKLKGLELVGYIDPDLPDDLIGDSSRLRQVLLNLISNAIKFTERGEVVVRVEQSAIDSEWIELLFSVQDSGIGIPQNRQEAIFEAFSQADVSTTRRFGGTGLSLTISQQLAQMMQGRIWLESTEGKGSTFRFTARLSRPTRETVRSVSREFASLEGTSSLVVDDNSVNRRILEELTLKWGMRPTAVSSGEEAIELLKKRTFPVVIIDAVMPGLGGFELAEHIRRQKTSVQPHLLLLTSPGNTNDAQRFRLGSGPRFACDRRAQTLRTLRKAGTLPITIRDP